MSLANVAGVLATSLGDAARLLSEWSTALGTGSILWLQGHAPAASGTAKLFRESRIASKAEDEVAA